jgi:hypothetical protein
VIKFENKMNKIYIFLLGIFSILITSAIVSAQGAVTGSNMGNNCNLEVELLNQDPYPAVPGEYVKVVFQVSGLDNSKCDGAKLRLVPTYPFSLDSGDELKEIDGNTYITGYKKTWMTGYKLRVDENAIGGENNIEIRYNPKTFEADFYLTEIFNITVEDARTSFDAVVQEYSGTEISIALANVGENTANAVIARIPQQDNYIASGTDGQMVGNLESGDYTIVGFEISPTRNSKNSGVLQFQVDYTDSIGERRTTIMNLTVGSSAVTNTNTTGFQPRMGGYSQGTQETTNWIVIGIIAIIIIIILLILYAKRKAIYLRINRGKKNNLSPPDWIKNEKQSKR